MISSEMQPPPGRAGAARWLLPLMAAALVCRSAAAQPPAPTQETPPTGILQIRSEPPGAMIRLYGEHRWTGTTPWDLQRGIEGDYRVVARLAGYEKWQRTVTVVRGESRELDIRLTPKEAWKAGVRSMILPGWGQAYSERPGKGAIFTFGTLALAGGLVWFDEDYRNRTDDYKNARRSYFDATNVDELDALRARADRASDRADRAYDRRRLFLYATAGAYAASVLDAFFLFPEPAEGSFASVSPWGERGPEISLGAPRGELALSVRWMPTEGGAR
jgi:hypothetical protein